MPEAVWAATADTFCDELVQFAVQSLGCVHPSEATIQKLVVLSMLKSATVNVALKTPWESKRAFVDVVKGLVKKYRGDNQAAYVFEYITSLPTSPLAFRRQYPRQYQHAYAGAEPGPCQNSRSDIQQLVSAVPMRTFLRRLSSLGALGKPILHHALVPTPHVRNYSALPGPSTPSDLLSVLVEALSGHQRLGLTSGTIGDGITIGPGTIRPSSLHIESDRESQEPPAESQHSDSGTAPLGLQINDGIVRRASTVDSLSVVPSQSRELRRASTVDSLSDAGTVCEAPCERRQPLLPEMPDSRRTSPLDASSDLAALLAGKGKDKKGPPSREISDSEGISKISEALGC